MTKPQSPPDAPAHAKLSPSSAARWLSCPASIRMINEHTISGQDDESPFAREGTIAHDLAEIEASYYFELISEETYREEYNRWLAEEFAPQQYTDGTLEEMATHVQEYVDLIELLISGYDDATVLFEQRMDTGVPGVWGTSDAVILTSTHIGVVDFKYGMGVPVSATGNPQLRSYGLGAAHTYGGVLGDTKTVSITVHQPRLSSVSTEHLSYEELLEWRDEVLAPGAARTADPDAPFGPSEIACQFCPVAGMCRARVEAATMEDFGGLIDPDEEAFTPPKAPDLLTPEEVATALGRVSHIKKWLKDFEAAALEMAYTREEPIPGYKVVRSGGRRVVKDEEAFIQAFVDAGYSRDQIVNSKPKGFGDLEKLVRGRKKFDAIAAQFVGRSEGSESIVPESDKRPAITPAREAAEEFADHPEDSAPEA